MRLGGCKAMPSALPYWRLNMWTKPEYTEMRFGFEVTMYIANR
jgi:coenzyme PQQ precursor peptide PqqA